MYGTGRAAFALLSHYFQYTILYITSNNMVNRFVAASLLLTALSLRQAAGVDIEGVCTAQLHQIL